jgi:hypothetical protein
MSYEQLLLKQYVEQTFTALPNIKVTFRTISGAVDEHVMRSLRLKYDNAWGSMFDAAASIYYMAASLQQVNDTPIGKEFSVALEAGDPKVYDVVWEERVKYVARLPTQMRFRLYQQYLLFVERVDKFIETGGAKVGNS